MRGAATLLATLFLCGTVSGQCHTAKISSASAVRQIISPNVNVLAPAVIVQPVLVPAFSFQFLPAQAQVQSSIVGASAVAAPPVPVASAVSDDWPVAVAFLGSASGNRGPEAALAILQRNCAQCHSFPGGKSGVNIVDRSGNLWGEAPRQRIARAVRALEMPPRGPLTETEISVIERWAQGK